MYRARPAGDSDSDFDSEDEYFGFVSSVKIPPKPQIQQDSLSTYQDTLIKLIERGNFEDFFDKLCDSASQWKFNLNDPIKGNWNLLFHACFNAQKEFVEYLVDGKSCTVNIQINSFTPLMLACNSDGDHDEVFEIVQFLVDREAIVNVSNTYGETPLMFATQKGHTRVVKLFVSMDASLNAISNTDGSHALLFAVEHQHKDIVKILLDAGSDKDIVNRSGYDAKTLAQVNNYHDILELFPKEVETYRAPHYYVTYQSVYDLVPSFSNNNIPQYFPDICKMLEGSTCEDLINSFAEQRVTLEEFLVADDEMLQKLGVKFSFKRNFILHGLLKFHERKWTKASMGLFQPNEKMDLLDFYFTFATLLKHLIVMKCGLIYAQNLQKQFGTKCNERAIKVMAEYSKSVREFNQMMSKLRNDVAFIDYVSPKEIPGYSEISVDQLLIEFGLKKPKRSLKSMVKYACVLLVPSAALFFVLKRKL